MSTEPICPPMGCGRDVAGKGVWQGRGLTEEGWQEKGFIKAEILQERDLVAPRDSGPHYVN